MKKGCLYQYGLEEVGMENIFLTKLDIVSVRHLHGIAVPLSDTVRKHLILTGKNGSGKTSTMESLKEHLEFIISDQYESYEETKSSYNYWKEMRDKSVEDEKGRHEKENYKKNMDMYARRLQYWESGVVSSCCSYSGLREKYKNGQFLLAYYGDKREFQVETYQSIEKVNLKSYYGLEEKPGNKLAKYLVDLKATKAFAKEQQVNGDTVERIDRWFHRLEEILKEIFSDPTLSLEFDVTSFQFTLKEAGHESFDFNTLSSGYAAVLDIVNDLIIRMEAQTRLRDAFDTEGIVLIDEIETHLHLELQKKIFPILTKLFPNLQFIITTHSPFILNSLENAVIYDLEKNILVKEGMQKLPYEGIVEGYFGADRLSDELRKKYERYVSLVDKKELTDAEYAEIDSLEYYLDEIPDYLAAEFTAEYNRLKLEFANRG